jgi:hypothetical protein
VSWSGEETLSTIVEVHVLVVITVPHSFESPSGTILELLWNVPPLKVFSSPAERWHAVTCVGLEQVESWSKSEGASNRCFPEAGPFNHSGVLVNSFTLLEVKCGIWIHRWCLHEWLELVTGMCWRSLDTQDALNRFFSENWVAKSISNMREFLIISPFDFELTSLIVIVVTGGWSVLQLLLEVDFLSL